MDENNEMTMVENTTPEETAISGKYEYEEGPSVAVVGLIGAAIGAGLTAAATWAIGKFRKNKKKSKEKESAEESKESEVAEEKK